MNVKYGAHLRLRHVTTNHILKSLDKRFPAPPSKSRQQMVVATTDPSDSSTVWLVKGPHGTTPDYRKGSLVSNGDLVRLEHVNTRANLHSHPLEEGHLAPITRDGAQQEVTAVGAAGDGDENDDWIVQTQGEAHYWALDTSIRLIHKKTGRPLHSHDARHEQKTAGFQEVTAYISRDANDYWSASDAGKVEPRETAKISQRNRVSFVLRLLEAFPECAGYLRKRRSKPILRLNSEPDIQDVLYLTLRPSIRDLKAEHPVSSNLRQYSIEDFRSRSLRIVLEAKFVRNAGHAKKLSVEINDDIGKYKADPACRDLVVFIYDPNKHIEAPAALKKEHQGTHAHGRRRISVHIVIKQ